MACVEKDLWHPKAGLFLNTKDQDVALYQNIALLCTFSRL